MKNIWEKYMSQYKVYLFKNIDLYFNSQLIISWTNGGFNSIRAWVNCTDC